MSASIQSATKTNTNTTLDTIPQSGLIAGAIVMTLNGPKPVEALQAGDRIITRNGMRVLKDVVTTKTFMRPIRIAHGTLGCSRPKQDMLVAPGLEILVRDWRAEVLFGSPEAIVPVSRMVDGTHIAPFETEGFYTTYTLAFDNEEIFYADGIEVVAPQNATTAQELCLAL